AGWVLGWGGRAPDLKALSTEPARLLPGLGILPRWSTIPRQASPQEQLRYAQLRAPRDEWPAAWLAVPGYYPQSHDSLSKAYLQLARIWYRQNDVDSLDRLGSELADWKDAQTRDQELIAVIRIAVKLRKGDVDAVVKGFENRMQAGVTDMYNPALVAMSLEVCSDALQAVQKSGNPTLGEPLRRAL